MRKRMKNKKYGIIGIIMALILCHTVSICVFAAPSISDLHGEEKDTVIESESTDDTNTAEILSALDIYSDEAVFAQYMERNEDEKLVSTPLSDTIQMGMGTIREVDMNGMAIPEKICSVEDMMNVYFESSKYENKPEPNVRLDHLDQLTYWLDFKYRATAYRVIGGEMVEYKHDMTMLENGMMMAEIEIGEILRAGKMEDYVIIQIDASTGAVHYIKMKEYDPDDGSFTAVFPCIGPFMITQIME